MAQSVELQVVAYTKGDVRSRWFVIDRRSVEMISLGVGRFLVVVACRRVQGRVVRMIQVRFGGWAVDRILVMR